MKVQWTTSPWKVTHCTGYILVNTRPHQLGWGD